MFENDEKSNIFIILIITAVIVSSIFFIDAKFNNESSGVLPQTIKNSSVNAGFNNLPEERVAIYSWIDSSGTINYSDKPSLSNKQALKVIYVDQNINVINMPKLDPSIKTTKNKMLPIKSTFKSNVINLYENKCRGFRKWSIDYRECRARVHTELKKNCFSLRGKLNQAVGDRYKTIKRAEKQICLAYANFAIID